MQTKFADIPVEQLVEDEGNVRSKLSGIEELAVQIRQDGILQPILVRPMPNDPGRYQIIAGHRRFAAAKLAGLTSLPAIVRAVDDNEKTALQLAENIQREGLSAIEIAEGLKALVATCGDVHRAAERLGQTANWVNKHLALLKVDPKIVRAIHRAKLGISQAREVYALARSGKIDEAVEAAGAMSDGKLSRDALAKRNKVERDAAKGEAPTTIASAKRIFERSIADCSILITVGEKLVLDAAAEKRIDAMLTNFEKILGVAA